MNSNDKKIKFAVVGAGHIGKRHAEMICRESEGELVAMVDVRSKEECNAENFNVPFFNTIEELFKTARPTNYLSSPLPNEELIIPLTIDKKSADNLRLIPYRRHFRKTRKNKNALKRHKTYRVYKRRKHPSSRRKSHTSRRHIYL